MAAKTQFIPWFGAVMSAEDFEAIYNTELPRVYHFFCYRFGEGPLAEDLTSTTFEKAWRGRNRFRQQAAFSTWLFSIARRVAQDYYRQLRNVAEVSLDSVVDSAEGMQPEARLGGAILEEQLDKRLDFAHLSLLLAQLADRERELVALKYGAGFTNRAIAQLTRLTESNVAVILYRTLQTLRSLWEAQL